MHLRKLEVVKWCRSCAMARVVLAGLVLRAHTSYTYHLVECKLKKVQGSKPFFTQNSSGQSVSCMIENVINLCSEPISFHLMVLGSRPYLKGSENGLKYSLRGCEMAFILSRV
jgi:hypothetical protein